VRKVGRAPDLAFGISWGFGDGSVSHWPLAVWSALFYAAGRVSVLALGRVSVWIRLSGGIGLWPCFSPDKPVRWRKTKHPTFEAFTKPKNLC